MVRSIIGVIVGFTAWSVLWVGSYAGLSAAAPDRFPTEPGPIAAGALALLLAISVVCSLVAGVATSAIARSRRSVLVLGGLLLAVGIAVQAGSWSLMPVWYHAVFLVLLVPMTVVGGRLVGVSSAPTTTARSAH
jgi:hypothetical protein